MTKSIQKRCILFVGMLGLMMACAKEKTTNPSPPREIETLQPSNYLMAYPKSWWIYVDTKGGQPVKIQTGEAFELDSAPVRPQNEPYVDYVVKKVPRYNGLPLWGNQKHVGTYTLLSRSREFTTLIPDSSSIITGTKWFSDETIKSDAQTASMVLASDTSMLIHGVNYDHIVVIRSGTALGGSSTIHYIAEDRYYVKNIGLVGWRRYISKYYPKNNPFIHLPVDSAISDYGLKDYFINH
jgi:hypothetical protein